MAYVTIIIARKPERLDSVKAPSRNTTIVKKAYGSYLRLKPLIENRA